MYNEGYLKENDIYDKTEKEKNQEIIMNIFRTRMELNTNIKNYEYAQQDQVDYYLYQIKANQAKLDYLIKKAKEKKIELNNIEKLKYEA